MRRERGGKIEEKERDEGEGIETAEGEGEGYKGGERSCDRKTGSIVPDHDYSLWQYVLPSKNLTR